MRTVRVAAALVVVMVMVVAGAGAAVAQPAHGSQTVDVGSGAEAEWTYVALKNYKTNQCMGTVNGSVAVGTKVIQRSCTSLDPDQVWLVYAVTNTWTTIRNSKNTNMCLAVPGSSLTKGTQLGVYQCSGNDDQVWIFQGASPYVI